MAWAEGDIQGVSHFLSILFIEVEVNVKMT